MVNNLLASLRQNVDKINLIHSWLVNGWINPGFREHFHNSKTRYVDYCLLNSKGFRSDNILIIAR